MTAEEPRILVCGSRGWSDQFVVEEVMRQLPMNCIIIHGGAIGADRLAGWFACSLGLRQEVHIPDWNKYGKIAGLKRNIMMLESGIQKVIAFWDGRSHGTEYTIREAKKRKIIVEVYKP